MEKFRPYVILNAAISIDGKIASKNNDSKLSSKVDLKRVHKLRSNVDAVLVGKNTVKRDDPLLTVRHIKGKNPIRVILDSSGSISINSKILKTSKKIPTIIATSSKISARKKSLLEKHHVDVIIAGKNHVNLRSLLRILKQHGIKKLLVEGGSTVNWEFISKKFFDELIITITPFVLGGKNAVSLVNGYGFSKIIQSPRLKLKQLSRQDNEVVLHYVKL